MFKKIIILSMLLVCLIPISFADEPPSWSDFEIKSANKEFLAKIQKKEGDPQIPARLREYQITVFSVSKQDLQPIWSCDYSYDGYYGGMLSDDGSTFAYVNFWYYPDAPVVTIYQNGVKKGTLKGTDFRIPLHKIKPTLSHRLWLKEEELKHQFISSADHSLVLEIKTIDNKIHHIDVDSVTFLK